MAVSRVWLCLFSVWFIVSVPCHSLSPALPAVLGALGKVIRYYESSYHELNLDGLFGLRVIEGQLIMLSDEADRGELHHLPMDVRETIKHYATITSKTAQLGLQAAREDDPEYFDSMAYVVAHPWTFHIQNNHIDASKRWDANIYSKAMKTELKESTSDSCMGELTGNSLLKIQGCQISSSCVDIMTYKGLTQYGITHQLLWSMLGEKAGCRKQMDEAFSKTDYETLDGFRQEFCTNNYFEMRHMTENYLNGTIIPLYQDVFLEEQFVCPNLGFGNFLSLGYLEQILSWQKEGGCYGKMAKVKFQAEKELLKSKTLDPADYDYEDEKDIYEQNLKKKNVIEIEDDIGETGVRFPGVHNDSIDLLHHQVINNAQETFHGNHRVVRKLLSAEKLRLPLFGQNAIHLHKSWSNRKLLVEKEMYGGCLSHKTAVAGGALVMYLRYLIKPGDTGLDKGNIKLTDPGKKRGILQQYPRYYQDVKDKQYVDKYDPYVNENEEEGYVDGKLPHENQQEFPDRDKLYKEDEVGENGNNAPGEVMDEEEYPYYDENVDDRKLRGARDGIVHLKAGKADRDEPVMKNFQSSPKVHLPQVMSETNTAVVIIFIACFIILFLIMYRFIKKRRIHIRYHTRSLFGL